MADLSVRLSRALDRGRADKGVPSSRAEILVTLLRKRAEAYRFGMGDRERKLRDQIIWSLPVHEVEDSAEPAPVD